MGGPGRFAIAATREWRPARALQLQIAARTVHVDDFAEQQRPAVTELRRESTELVAGVGLRPRLGPFGQGIPRQCRNALGRLQPLGVERELGREPAVETNERRLGNEYRVLPGEEPFRQPGVGVVKVHVGVVAS